MAVNITDWAPGQTPRAPDNPVAWHPPQRLNKLLGAGAGGGTGIIAANDTNGEVIPVLGSGRIRVVAKVSAAGTLRLRWRLADHVTDLATAASNPADPGTALVANTELVIDVPNNPGHAFLEIAIVNGAAPSTIAYVDVFQTNTPN
ncbi:MAG TPA: hypothetical protein VEU74_12050 [Gemmatimonadales bacterium]|nr:hypothetical protein [Gemmatimonadales bacterium]